MKFFRNIGIKAKILMPALSLILLPVLAIFLVDQYFFEQNLDKEIVRLAKNKINTFNTNLLSISDKAEYVAGFASALPVAQRAYQAYYSDTIGLMKSSLLLEKNFDRKLQILNARLEYKAKIQFWLPPATCFVRTWHQERGDDQKHIRKSVLTVTNTHKPVRGLEYTRSGLAICGVMPIFADNNSRLYGTVDVIIPLNELLNSNKIEDNEEFALLVNKKEYDKVKELFFTQNQLHEAIGNFYLLSKSSDNFITSKLSEENINTAFNKHSDIHSFSDGKYRYVLFNINDFSGVPIALGVYQIDISDKLEALKENQTSILTLALIAVFLGFLVIYFTTQAIITPIKELQNNLLELGKGKLPEHIPVSTGDEIGETALALWEWVRNLRQTVSFSIEIAKGNYDVNFVPVSKKDILGNTLLNLRETLKNNRELAEKRRKKEEGQKWKTQGIAELGEILRHYSSDMQQLSDNTIKHLVKYLAATQGALFILENETKEVPVLKLLATYAYNRKKYLDKKIEMGEGLVGMCAFEKETVYLTDVPDDYIEIESGIGSAVPKNILLVPLKFEDEIFGVVELNSLKSFQKEEIDFVERVSASIASSISNAKTSSQTTFLLSDSRKQQSILEEHEKNMQESMRKLKETQASNMIKEASLQSFIDSVNHSVIRANYNKDGILIYANSRFLKTMNYSSLEVQGKHYSMFLHKQRRESFAVEWQELIEGGKHLEKEVRFKTKHGVKWLLATFTAMRNRGGEITEILFLAIDISKQKEYSLKYEQEIDAIDKSILKSEYLPDGTVLNDNDLFLKTLGYTRKETESFNLFNILSAEKKPHFRKIWRKILSGIHVVNTEQMLTKDGVSKWFKGTYTPVYNYDGDVEKIIYLSTEITELKENEQKINQEKELLNVNIMELENEISKLTEIQNHLIEKEEKLLKKTETAEKASKRKTVNIELKNQEIESLKNSIVKIRDEMRQQKTSLKLFFEQQEQQKLQQSERKWHARLEEAKEQIARLSENKEE